MRLPRRASITLPIGESVSILSPAGRALAQAGTYLIDKRELAEDREFPTDPTTRAKSQKQRRDPP